MLRIGIVGGLLGVLSLAAWAQSGPPSGPLTRYPGNPLLRNGPESYDYWKTGPRAVLKRGPADYRMWYEAVGSDNITRMGYATSADGLAWTKQGTVMSPDLATWEKEEISPNSILFEGGLYKLWYHGGGYIRSGMRLGNGRIGYATSADGISWTRYPGNAVLDVGAAGAIDDAQVAEPRVLRVGGAYRMYYTAQDGSTTRLCMASGADGVNWTKSPGNPVLDASAWGGFWGGAIFQEGGVWHLWHARTPSGLHYKSSPDGIAWTDGPSNPVLTTSADPGAPDYGLVGDSVSGFRDGDAFRILYTGYNSNLFGTLGRFEGICAASIVSPPPSADADGDGMPDAFEAANGFDPSNGDQDANGTLDGQDDWDGDGTANQNDASPGSVPGGGGAVSSGSGGDGGGGCGATGIGACLLAFLACRRVNRAGSPEPRAPRLGRRRS